MINDFDDVVIPSETPPVAAVPPVDTPPVVAPEDTPPTPALDAEGNPTEVVADIAPPVEKKFGERKDDLLDVQEPIDAVLEPDKEVFLGVADILKKQGFFGGDADLSEITSAEALGGLFDKEVKARLDDRQREIQNYMNDGVPYSVVSKLEAAIEEIEGVTEEGVIADPELSKTLVLSDLRNKGFDEDTVAKFYDMIEKSDSLGEEAVKAFKARRINLSAALQKEKDSAKANRDAQVAAQAAQTKKLTDKLQSKEVFGRKVSPIAVEKLTKLASTTVAYTEQGQPLNALMKFRMDNPLDFEHKLLYLFSATEGFKNLNVFDRSAESRISGKFRDAVVSMSDTAENNREGIVSKKGVTIDIDSVDDII